MRVCVRGPQSKERALRNGRGPLAPRGATTLVTLPPPQQFNSLGPVYPPPLHKERLLGPIVGDWFGEWKDATSEIPISEHTDTQN